ncbi:MAG: hypothetical protein HC867_02935 [Bacteroidia bacterium]|nr:hypothetical protein [Bacteroidia bacterium]
MHGDPAIKLNGQPKPDYVIEEQLLKITPGFISIAETGFDVDAKFINMGKAVDQDIAVEIKRQYPDGSIVTAFKDTIPGIRYIDSVLVTLPIDPNRDKGLNRITITIDADGVVDEMYETNNSITKDIFIFEDEIRPIYPQDHAIVNRQNIKLVASTANPFTASKVYRMEIDTTELFNSSFKLTQNITSSGGIIEYVPGFHLATALFITGECHRWILQALRPNGIKHHLFTSQEVMRGIISHIFTSIPIRGNREFLLIQQTGNGFTICAQ